jgi:hypothetical protein
MSDWAVEDEPDGFRVVATGGRALHVRFRDWDVSLDAGAGPPVLLEVFSVPTVSLAVAQAARGLQDAARRHGRLLPPPPDAWALAPRVAALRDRRLAALQPHLGRVEAALRRVGCQVPHLAHEPALYRDGYTAADVVRFPAAASALGCVGGTLPLPGQDRPVTLLDLARAMRGWRGLFSPTCTPYRSLNRTLAALPRGVPATTLGHLRHVRLEHPVKDRPRLLLLLLYAARSRDTLSPGDQAQNLHVLQHATPQDLEDALRALSLHLRRPLRPSHLEDLRTASLVLADFPGAHHGKLTGLAKKAVRWHQLPAQAKGYPPSMPTAPPPVPPPGDPHVRFLATVGQVVEEGRVMGHCAASYADRAVRGRCFLFHVDDGQSQATVEVDHRGTVQQAQGPGNQDSPAAAWGARVLRAWADTWRSG